MNTDMQGESLTEESEEESDDEAAQEQTDETTTVSSPTETAQPIEIEAPDLYHYDRCTIHLTVTFLPDDGHTDGRQVILGVRNDQDTPLIAMPYRENQLALPELVLGLLADLKADLPKRKQRMQEKLRATQTKLAQEAAARKQKAAQPTPEPQKTVAAETTTPAPSPASATQATGTTKLTKTPKQTKEVSDLEQLSFL